MTAYRKLKIEELNRISVDEFRHTEKIPLIVVLDNVRSLHNVGAVFRTSDAFCIEAVYLCGITSTPPDAEIHKTALGAELSMEWKYFEQTTDAIESLKKSDYTVCAIEQVDNSTMLSAFKVEKNNKYAVVLGNEVKGVQQSAIDLADCCIELPQYGTKHSLNVSVTAGIVIWEFSAALRG